MAERFLKNIIKNAALRIALIYAVTAILYIIFSDQILLYFAFDAPSITKLQMYKGWAFVIVTATMLYFLLKREISKQRVKEKELQKSQRRFKDLANNSTDWIWEFDENFIFTYSSLRVKELLGYTPEEIMGMSVFDLMPSSKVDNFRIEFEKAKMEQESFASIYNMYQQKNGKLVHIESSGVPVFDGDRMFKGYRGINRDISERILLQQQLNQSQKLEAIGTMAGGIAHDFNNILSALIGYTELAQNSLDQKENLDSYLREIMNGSLRAKDLVDQILTFSRKSKEDTAPIKMRAIIKEAVKLIRATIPTTIEIKLNLNDGDETILANPTQIHQIIMNLCTNAYQAIKDEAGTITVSLEVLEFSTGMNQFKLQPGKYIVLNVSDTGKGMTKEIQERIFEPYFTTKAKGEGTGLGLSVVHGIIKGLKGAISVDSKMEQGSTFKIYLPAYTSKTIQKESQINKIAHGNNEHILLVDDDKAISRMIKKMLEQLNYKVKAFTSSEEAYKVFDTDPMGFDMIITDMTMPGLSGLQLAKKAMQKRSDIPVILCTGFSDSVNEKKAEEMGIKKFMKKPIIRNELAASVQEVLSWQNS